MIDQNETAGPVQPLEQPEPAKLPNSLPLPPEIGGQKGPEPTRFGDWEKNGRCTDF